MMSACPGVQSAVAVAATRPTDAVVELAVFYTGDVVHPAQLTKYLAEILPKGMLPTRYTHLDEFPLNSNRKIDRGRLARDATAAFGG